MTRRAALAGLAATGMLPLRGNAKGLRPLGLVTDIPAMTLGGSDDDAFVTEGYAARGIGAARLRRLRPDDPAQPWEIATADKVRLAVAEPRLELEMFGAMPDGASDCLRAFDIAALHGLPIDLNAGTYLMSGRMLIGSGNRTATVIQGKGPAASRILIANHADGLWILGDPALKPRVHLCGFAIGRTDAARHAGAAGPKTVYVKHANGVLISDLEEWAAIGMGIVLDGCENYEVSGCHVHDHKSGSNYLGGTDGIHIYRCPGPGEVHGNRVENVGDDAISFGSYDADGETADFDCFGNTVRNTAGSIKVYGNARRFRVYDNDCRGCHNGGVTLWDDQDAGHSFDLVDGTIFRNRLSECGGAGPSGGVYLAQTKGTGRQAFRNIAILENEIANCPIGVSVSVAGPQTKTNSDVVIRGNRISDAAQWGIIVEHAARRLVIAGNAIDGAGYDGILVRDGVSSAPLEIVMQENSVSQAGSRGPGVYCGIRIKDSGAWLRPVATGNRISNLAQGSRKAFGIVFGEVCDPTSIIEGNSSDPATTRGIAYPVGGFSAPPARR